jgi:hypothetical protein
MIILIKRMHEASKRPLIKFFKKIVPKLGKVSG